MKFLQSLQGVLQPKSRRKLEPDFNLVARRPDPPVASILRDLDEIFGLSLTDVGNIISSGTTTPREEIIAGMLEWAKGANSEFAKSKYFPRLQMLRALAQAMSGHLKIDSNLERALSQPLPASIDPTRRSIASYIQSDDFTTLAILKEKLLR
ncbi:MAG: hypothetical protein NVSMB39_6060 [Candidatus Saccharimonadales bacterium]